MLEIIWRIDHEYLTLRESLPDSHDLVTDDVQGLTRKKLDDELRAFEALLRMTYPMDQCLSLGRPINDGDEFRRVCFTGIVSFQFTMTTEDLIVVVKLLVD